MSNSYNDVPITIQQRRRACQVVIDNPKVGAPRISFLEEIVRAFPDGTSEAVPVPGMTLEYDPALVVNLIDPTTGAPTGQTLTAQQMYVSLYSLYFQLAQARDALAG
jgi:hypothetical protein